MRFSRQEYWSGLPRPPPRDLSDPGTEPASSVSPALAGGFFTTLRHLGSSYMGHSLLLQMLNSAAATWKQPQTNVHKWTWLCFKDLFTQTGSQPLGPCQLLPYSMDLLVIFLPSWRKSLPENWANGEENKRLREVLLRLAPESFGARNPAMPEIILNPDQWIIRTNELSFSLNPGWVGFTLTCNHKSSNKLTVWSAACSPIKQGQYWLARFNRYVLKSTRCST